MPHDPLTTWSREVTWQVKSLISPIPQSLWPPILTRRWLMMRITQPLCHMTLWPRVTWSHVTKWELSISSSKSSMINKLSRVVTNDQGNSPIVSHDSLTTKSREVTWQTKNKIYSLAQRLWPPNLAGRRLIMRGIHSCHMTLWPRGHMRSHDKLKTKYLLFNKVDWWPPNLAEW